MRFSRILKIQKRIVSAETIPGNTVCAFQSKKKHLKYIPIFFQLSTFYPRSIQIWALSQNVWDCYSYCSRIFLGFFQSASNFLDPIYFQAWIKRSNKSKRGSKKLLFISNIVSVVNELELGRLCKTNAFSSTILQWSIFSFCSFYLQLLFESALLNNV